MWILSNFDLFIFIVVLVASIMPTLKACALLYSLIKLIIQSKSQLYRWKNGIITLEDLQHLTPLEFQYWCGDFIKKLGYTNIVHSKLNKNDTGHIVCKKIGETAYIECPVNPLYTKSNFYVDETICKKLVGEMVHDEVTIGMIITSGIITDKAIKYINSLPKKYTVELLDGNDIIDQYSYLHKRKYSTI